MCTGPISSYDSWKLASSYEGRNQGDDIFDDEEHDIEQNEDRDDRLDDPNFVSKHANPVNGPHDDAVEDDYFEDDDDDFGEDDFDDEDDDEEVEQNEDRDEDDEDDCPICAGFGSVHTRGGEKDSDPMLAKQDVEKCPCCKRGRKRQD